MSPQPIPVTFLVGFLGAGKTTLLNRLLTAPGGPPIAVVVNEFGDAGIDGSLVVGGQDELIELDGGCVCCTVRGDLSRTLRELAVRHKRLGKGLSLPLIGRRKLAFERVVIEASGLASPGPAVQTLVVDGELAGQYRSDGVVALAALPSIVDQLARFPEAAEQLAYADLVVETHADRAEKDAIAQARAALDAVAPGARRAAALRGDLAASEVFDLNPDPLELAERIERAARERNHEGHDHGPGEACDAPVHSSGLGSVSLRTTEPLQRKTLEMWLRFLGTNRRAEVLRIKGRVRAAGEPCCLLIQGIHQWLEIEVQTDPAPDESVLVIIGRHLDEAELLRGWAKLTASA